ncbi:MAG: ABC transporter ATP-binding protein [Candidatus Nealsonbacteria bacterium RIFCSPLOWO2_12_FULL_39_31]|uniref:ABC transporter ATP-binding protein n=3 Tax=Candidatus Nealsoniibacteriota TaxID=1817911 RepID=A0A1G2ELS7_9BACT|nr:MAG: ABC-type Mn/Zn transport system ATPase component [Parcubacteria group bacterium GW2011_GWA2_38_27]OGZ19421.1 MAG: ABC transporter ATP-binding protein [Candidatus Nealsonbacteria bacterium RIFCSPHIGHO2_01_FULL_38_55]OGZ20781.1 MAG: ABC transporter ATP-binding protein [Candidatus Nealsonbacteria bacterium RIFCSPHIGHO2_02_38_10]OGZ21692.1 MAG: ABC transporter ATP-binding protein [Candidatus Nealsonbacteria bacterium RIFCSPHIGHO2_02_FULL_38_75]OGZ22399.1 MAG: ABC transporter ATP-binding pro
MAIISAKNVSFGYGGAVALDNVSFNIEQGDYIALVGPNGAGKTTLIKILLGLEKSNNGSIKIFDKDVSSFNQRNKIGYLPQKIDSFNPLFPATAVEVVALGLLSRKKYLKRLNKNDRLAVAKVLEIFGISDLKNRLVSELSGGQQQRVFLARAMVSEPSLLILDEPSAALDPQIRENFFEIIEKINKEKKTTIILITHDIGQVGEYAEKMLYLDRKIIFYGKFSDFCLSKEMTERFGNFSQHLICHQHKLP